MTYLDIQTEVADRLRLTSATALARIGRSINERYRWAASSVGMATTVRVTVTATTTIGSRSLTFGPTPTGVEKLYTVYNTAQTPPLILTEIGFEEMREQIPGTDPPEEYALQTIGPNSVTIYLDCVPGSAYVLTADADSNIATINGLQVPAFPEDFHNMLVYGAMATELDRQEKYDMAQVQEARFQNRLSELRLFIAMSAYKDVYQGKNPDTGIQNQLV